MRSLVAESEPTTMTRSLLAVLTLLPLAAAVLAGERSVLRARGAALSPDGSQIVFQHRGDLWIAATEGGQARRLTSHPAYESAARWSPDGRRIAFNSNRHGSYDAFVVDAAGGEPVRVTRHSGYDLVEQWFDAETLLVRTSRAGSTDLALVPLDGTTPRLLTRTPLDPEMYACVVPGGDRILLSDKSAYRYRRRRFHGSAAADIWELRLRGEGPRWRKLVDTEWNDLRPQVAADGRIWFESNRSGTPNLWSIAPDGSDPRQETRYEGRGVSRLSISRDGKVGVFDREDRIHRFRVPDAEAAAPVDIRIAVDGRPNPIEHRTENGRVDEFEISPDGKLAAVVVLGEVFVYPTDEGGLARNVSSSVGRETQIAWGSDSRTLYFVSDRDGNREVYRTDLVLGTTERLTETPENEAWPTPSPDGKSVVWLVGFDRLRIVAEIPGDRRRERLERVETFRELTSTPYPDDLDVNEAARLEEVAEAVASGSVVPPDDLEKSAMPVWLRALGACDPETEEGQRRILRLSASLRVLTGYPMADPVPGRHDAHAFRLTGLHWARYWKDRTGPDKPLAFKAPEGFEAPRLPDPTAPVPLEIRLRLADMALWNDRPFDWSPDSLWIAIPERGPGYRLDIRLVNAKDGVTHPATAHPTAYHPRFSRDGAWLTFLSDATQDDDVHVLRLTAPERTFPDDPIRKVLEPSEKEKKPDGEKVEPIAMRLEGLSERAVDATSFPTNEAESVLAGDGKTLLFTADLGGSRELWSIPAPHVSGGRTPKQLTRGERPRRLRLSPDGKRVFYLASGRVRSMSVGGGSARTHDFRAELAIDRAAQMRYVLDEALWLLGTWFYDPALHGADWSEISTRYRKLLAHTAPGLDFEVLLDDLCAELDASHLGASGAPTGAEGEPETGELGIELDDAALVDGRIVVETVLAEGPADHPDAKLAAGDEILRVNGAALGRGVNFHGLLRGTVGRRVVLDVKGRDGKEREVVVKPANATTIRNLRYERWVRERREMVRKWSGGKLAYLHVRSMNTGPRNRFRREIMVETEGKEGAIIDVRYNSGGWTAVHLLDVLSRRTFVLRSFRNGARVSENRYRDRGVEIPLVALTNHASFSNAEIFSEGFRRLELGPVVGVPTAGGVIGTGSWTLLNGMRLRRPSWGAWTLDGENLEGNGRPVTHRVENGPGREGHAEDRQLRKAVELLMKR
jgi:tricorn protease